METKIKTVLRVMESLVKFNGWTVERFDVQAFSLKGNIEGYAGYLDVKELDKRIIIRNDGSFEYSELY